jgi:hypothetical protein
MKKYLSLLPSVLLLIGTLAAYGQSTGVAEHDVTILESIKSTGLQAFNTGYTHKANTRVVMDCNVTRNTQRNWEALLGGRLNDFRSNAFCFFARTDGSNVPCFNRTGHEPRGTGFVYGERIILTCEGQTATWVRYSDPETQAGSVTTTGTVDDGKTPMLLFNLNTSSTEGEVSLDTSPSVMTLYGCKIYEGETLKCDFVPARYNGVVGLYDRVNQTFSSSLTGTPFFAPDLANYERALNAIVDGHKYRVFTEVGGLKYYVTADGYLTTEWSDAPAFLFHKVAGYEYDYGFQLKNGNICFTNPRTYSVAALTEGHLNTADRSDGPRSDWEAQVFFLNEQGKYAVRSTNARSGDTEWSWIGCAYWTVNDGPLAEYSFDMNYVWQLEAEDVTAYAVIAAPVSGGMVAASTSVATEGSKVVVTVHPDDMMQMASLTVTTLTGQNVEVASVEGSYTSYSFVMPVGAINVTVTPTFTDIDPSLLFPVWVGGKQVTQYNKTDVLGDGLVSYTPGDGSGTLTFTGNPTISGVHHYALVSAEGIDLTVNVANGLTLSSSDYPYGIYLKGRGKTLTVNVPNSDLTISTLSNAIYTQGDLVITGKNLTVTKGTIYSSGSISIDLTGMLDAPSTYGGGVFLSCPGDITVNSSFNLKLGICSNSNGHVSLSGEQMTINAQYGYCISGNNVSIAGGFTGTSQSSGANIIIAYGDLTIGDRYFISTPVRGRVEYDSEANANVIVDVDGNRATSVKILRLPDPSVLTADTGELTLQNGGELRGTGGSDTHIFIADGATVTLRGATIHPDGEWAGITCLGDATIILGGMAFVNGGQYCPGIYVPAGKTLTIMGSGTLIATGDENAAGIGGGYYGHPCANAGNIVINSGNVIAKGGTGAAGIGSGRTDGESSGQTVSCGNITITGGSVSAEGGGYGVGIGTGYGRRPAVPVHSICGDITISGGSIDARGGTTGAAAIGSAKYGNCGAITITEGITWARVTGQSYFTQVIGKTDNSYCKCGTVTIGTTSDANITSNCTLYGINAANFPDEHFRNFLFTQVYGQDHVFTSEEMGTFSGLDASGWGIASFSGIDNFPSLATVKVYGNRCKGDNMQQLINHLPTVTNGQLFAIDSSNPDERNIITVEQVAAANAKGWTVYDNGNPTAAYTGATFTIPAGATDLSTKSGIYVAQNGEVLSGLGGSDLQLQIAAGATVTLHDADVTLPAANAENHWAGITCLGDATLIFEGKDVVDGCADYPAIYVPENNTLTIKGEGTLSALGGQNAAGIGGGKTLNSGNISLEGAIIYAAGGINAAAIGSGQSGSCGTINISSDVFMVTATIAVNNSECVGKGYDGSCGEITLATDLKSQSSDDNKKVVYWTAIPVTENTMTLEDILTYVVKRDVTLGSRLKVVGKPTLILGEGTTLNAPMGIEVSYSPEECTLTIEGSGALNAYAENGDAAIGGSRGNRCGTVIIHGGQITVNSGDNSVGIGPGQWGDVHFGYLTLGWTNPSDFVSVNSVKFYNTDRISFAEGKKFLVDGTDTEATTDNIAGQKLLPMTSDVITESTTVLGDGCTYYVNADVTNANRIRVMGSAVLHLGEGATLTATKGFQVEDDNTLTIEGDGALIATAGTHEAAIGGGDGSEGVRDVPYGHIIINGGNVTATGGEDGAGIGGGVLNRPGTGSITINGGVVNATGGKEAAGIGGGANIWYSMANYEECGTAGTIIINGGQVTATGGTDAGDVLCAGIGRGRFGSSSGQLTLGWTLESDYLQANSYDAGTVTFAQGKFFAVYTEGTKITPENIATANGKKLVPWFEPGTIDLSALTSDRKARNGDLVTGRLSGNYKISIADGATVTLRDVTINGVSEFDDDYSRLYEWAGITCEGDATIILEGENTVKGFFAYYPGIHVPEGKTLTIKGDGSLDASSNRMAVGIDGAFDIGGAAGIGGGYMLSCGNIVIEGGTITATGSEHAAGIGSGASAGEIVSACGNITITGGTVTASSTKDAAGIGCGYGEDDKRSKCGDITITDQVNCVTAISPDRPFALGKSISGECGKVTIGGIETGSITMYKFVYSPSSVAEGVVNLLTLNNDYVAQDGDILYGMLLANVRIKIADDATVTLRDAQINSKLNNDFTWAAIECLGNATLILEGENDVVGGYSRAGNSYYSNAGIYVPEDKTLTIKGTGSLSASTRFYWAAAIGGNKDTNCGNIVIEGGNIHAVGDQGAPGIGGASGGKCGDITITGGTIYAESKRFGAGIGSARAGSCGNITISGGDIYAKGGEAAAGIGSGAAVSGDYSSCGDITVTDGVTRIEALAPTGLYYYVSKSQLPIGAGDGGTCGTVTISQNLDDVSEDYSEGEYNTGKKRTLTRRIIPGDVNGDNKVTPADAIMILYYYFGVNQNGFVLGAADLNGDTKITPADAIEALYKYFGAGTANGNARASRPTANDSRDPE